MAIVNPSFETAGASAGNADSWPTQPSTGSSGLDLIGGAEDAATFDNGTPYEGFDAGWDNTGYLWAFDPTDLSDALAAPDSFDWYIQARTEFDEDDLQLGLTELFEWGQHVEDLVNPTSLTPEGFESGWNTTRENNMTSSETALFTGVVLYESCDTWTAVMV